MPDTTTQADLDVQTAFQHLASERRRAAAVAVAEHDDPLASTDLAILLAAREEQVPPEELTPHALRTVHRDLEAVHLPALVETDVLRERDGGYAVGPTLPVLLEAANAVHAALTTDD